LHRLSHQTAKRCGFLFLENASIRLPVETQALRLYLGAELRKTVLFLFSHPLFKVDSGNKNGFLRARPLCISPTRGKKKEKGFEKVFRQKDVSCLFGIHKCTSFLLRNQILF